MPVISRKTLGLGLAVLVICLGVVLIRLNRRVDQALETPVSNERPVELSVLMERTPLPFWGSEDIESVVETPNGLTIAGAFGVARLQRAASDSGPDLTRTDLGSALPTRRATSLTAWRTDLAAGLEDGGLFLYRDAAWQEIRSGYGALHVRALRESPAGELWIGAREGLFRMGLAERSMTRLHASPVRALALADDGRIISGGEKGLFSTQGGVTSALKVEGVEAPWIDDLTLFSRRVHAVTPTGLFASGTDEILRPVPGGENLVQVVVQDDSLLAISDPPEPLVRRMDASGRVQVERVSSPVRRLFIVGNRLLGDTINGLMERANGVWRQVSRTRQVRSFGHAHVGALAAHRGRVIVGFFDGALAELVAAPSTNEASPDTPDDGRLATLRPLEDSAGKSPVWAVNALLDAGGALHIASLRGAFRFDGSSFTAVEGSGAAFSLAQMQSGIAIGFGEGVLLPEQKLLSAFHGLPGNQATALAASEGGLLVGTPSGLGFIEGRSVRWRVASGDGKLPHPWVTAVLAQKGSVLVGTYGGGLTRRVGAMTDKGEWKPFVETEGLTINTGCLVSAGGRIYAGTDGKGIFRLTRDGTRFEALRLALPSQRVTALFEKDGFLYIGTDEGLTRWPVDGE